MKCDKEGLGTSTRKSSWVIPQEIIAPRLSRCHTCPITTLSKKEALRYEFTRWDLFDSEILKRSASRRSCGSALLRQNLYGPPHTEHSGLLKNNRWTQNQGVLPSTYLHFEMHGLTCTQNKCGSLNVEGRGTKQYSYAPREFECSNGFEYRKPSSIRIRMYSRNSVSCVLHIKYIRSSRWFEYSDLDENQFNISTNRSFGDNCEGHMTTDRRFSRKQVVLS